MSTPSPSLCAFRTTTWRICVRASAAPVFPIRRLDRPWAYGANLGYLRDPCRIGAIASTGMRKKRSSMDFPSS
jgi:hypothetical protein